MVSTHPGAPGPLCQGDRAEGPQRMQERQKEVWCMAWDPQHQEKEAEPGVRAICLKPIWRTGVILSLVPRPGPLRRWHCPRDWPPASLSLPCSGHSRSLSWRVGRGAALLPGLMTLFCPKSQGLATTTSWDSNPQFFYPSESCSILYDSMTPPGHLLPQLAGLPSTRPPSP